jgi:hypothetical protein
VALLLVVPFRELYGRLQQTRFNFLAPHFWILSVVSLGLFLFRHLTLYIQTSDELIGLPLRLWFALLTSMIIFYATLPAGNANDENEPAIATPSSILAKRLDPLHIELLLIFSFFTILLELPDAVYPSLWGLGAILFLVVGRSVRGGWSRLAFYSKLLFWATVGHAAFLSSYLTMPASHFMDLAWVNSLIGTVMVAFYILLNQLYRSDVSSDYPELFKRLGFLQRQMDAKPILFLYYPAIVGVALFLYWTFDHTLLTFFWSIEALVVFILAIVLRDNSLRILSYSGIAGVLVRLLFYDLSRTGEITRALVFIGVGAILILMNAIYNRFRQRIEPDQQIGEQNQL